MGTKTHEIYFMDISWYKKTHEITMTRFSWVTSWVHLKIHGVFKAFSWYHTLVVKPTVNLSTNNAIQNLMV